MSRLDRCYNVADMREEARRFLPKGVFEFVDRGAEDEVAPAANIAAFRKLKLRTRFAVDLTDRDMGTDLFGKRMSMPLIIAPTAAAGLCWYQGELALAKAAAKAGIPYTVATGSTTSIETIAREAGGRRFFQLYPWKEEDLSFAMVERARDLGYEALFVTIDVALGVNREYNARNGFANPFSINRRAVADMLMHPRWLAGVLGRYMMTEGMPRHENYPERYRHRITRGAPGERPTHNIAKTWDLFARLRKIWPGPLIAKSVLSVEDARRAVEAGADGIVVSNHGGRTLDSAVPTIEILPEIAAAVGHQTTVMMDSGIRRGSDIIKALALGAKAVLIGRATLYATAVAGEAGAAKMLQILATEFEKNMAYVGCRRVSEISREIFASPALRAGGTWQDDLPARNAAE